MVPWELLACAPVPGGGGALRLYRRGGEFSIRVAGCELMNSCLHGSEEALAELACAKIAGRPRPRLLVGGLGMGFTLKAALRHLGPAARVVVAELVPAVVAWNRGPLADLAGCPLEDRRVAVCETDVGRVLQAATGGFDAILLDVDNGPDGLTRRDNTRLYAAAGLAAAYNALRPAGVLGVWSIAPDPAFACRLRQAGFAVEEVRVRARGGRRGGRHTVWIAVRGA